MQHALSGLVSSNLYSHNQLIPRDCPDRGKAVTRIKTECKQEHIHSSFHTEQEQWHELCIPTQYQYINIILSPVCEQYSKEIYRRDVSKTVVRVSAHSISIYLM